jgi:hypothetical protein
LKNGLKMFIQLKELPGINNIINDFSRFLIILLFVYTGCSKLLGYEVFVNQLSQFAFLKKYAGFVAVSLSLLEIAVGLLIAINQTQTFGWWLSSVLMTSFTIYVLMMLLSRNHLPCTCCGVISSMTWRQHLIFNIFFMCLSWLALYNYYQLKNKIISTNKKEVS